MKLVCKFIRRFKRFIRKIAKNKQGNTYKMYGCSNRAEYLYDLTIKYDLSSEEIVRFANLLGEAEDFDALPVMIEHYLETRINDKSVK